jgi:hypothetical protein
MGYVIQNQLEKLVSGLESLDRDLRPHEWFTLRKEADVYYYSYDRMMRIYAERYVPKFENFGRMKARQLFADSHGDVRNLHKNIRDLSNRLEKTIKEKFKVFTQLRTRVTPPTKDEHFAPDRLPSYLYLQDRRLEMAEKGIHQMK